MPHTEDSTPNHSKSESIVVRSTVVVERSPCEKIKYSITGMCHHSHQGDLEMRHNEQLARMIQAKGHTFGSTISCISRDINEAFPWERMTPEIDRNVKPIDIIQD